MLQLRLILSILIWRDGVIMAAVFSQIAGNLVIASGLVIFLF
jgi:hypothetical protein